MNLRPRKLWPLPGHHPPGKVDGVQHSIRLAVLLLLLIFFFGSDIREGYGQAWRSDRPLNHDFRTVSTVCDSVSLDSLLVTVAHLTGEQTFTIDGVTDSIMTRYSYSPGLFQAQWYLVSRLETMGYDAELHPVYNGTLFDIEFAPDDPLIGWIGGTARVYRTTDGGQSWEIRYDTMGDVSFRSVSVLNAQTAYIVGRFGIIIKTTDGGDSWEVQEPPVYNRFFDVLALNDSVAWICGTQGLLLNTTNGGALWESVETNTSYSLSDITFSGDSLGWIVGSSGTVFHTTNGGATWFQKASGLGTCLYAVKFFDDSTGVAAGANGVLIRTTDGGSSWLQTASGSSTIWYDMNFIGSVGMAVGSGGRCQVSTDAGISWSESSSVPGKTLRTCCLVSESTAWTGGVTAFSRTDDLALTWASVNSSLPDDRLNNVVVTKLGTTHPEQVYIIGAHYDSRSELNQFVAPGADDNASGAAAVVEAARVLSHFDLPYTVRFILFAEEEQGCIGSYGYVSNLEPGDGAILGMINLDMIAFDSDSSGHFGIHAGNMTKSIALGQTIESNITEWGLDLSPDLRTVTATRASDHRNFWDAGIPAVLLIEDLQDFNPFYHSTGDLMDHFNNEFFAELTRLAVGTLAELSGLVTHVADTRPPGSFEMHAPYPNPFNSAVTLEFDLVQAGPVEVTVYDARGRFVRTLIESVLPAGLHHVRWDGFDTSGLNASSGVYIVRLITGDWSDNKKVILIR